MGALLSSFKVKVFGAENRYVADHITPLSNVKESVQESTGLSEKETSSHEDNHQKKEEEGNKSLEIGPFSVWALGDQIKSRQINISFFSFSFCSLHMWERLRYLQNLRVL